MLTQCPHCATTFPIEHDVIASAGGRVLCGVCEHEFDALAHLRRPQVVVDPVPRLDPELVQRQGDLFEAPRTADAAPRFARRRHRFGRDSLWKLALVVLSATLSLQIALAERDVLSMDLRFRAGYEQLCGVLGCSLPAWRQPERWTLVWREVGPHPSVGDGLMLTAAIRNDAEWAQPLPWLELRMADLDGQVVGLRRFSPAEYQTQNDVNLVAPGQTAALQLEIRDPGNQALAFTVDFR